MTTADAADSNPLAALGEALESAAETLGSAGASASANATASAKAAAQKQIELLAQAVDELKAQVVAQAAIYKAQQEKLESIDASLISLDNTSKATAAAPCQIALLSRSP